MQYFSALDLSARDYNPQIGSAVLVAAYRPIGLFPQATKLKVERQLASSSSVRAVLGNLRCADALAARRRVSFPASRQCLV